MRLKPQEINAIVMAVKRIFGKQARVWLFGSRVDDSLHGGDIDLYIECAIDHGLLDAKITFLNELLSIFGDQKIDVLVQSTLREQHPLGAIAKERGIEITGNIS